MKQRLTSAAIGLAVLAVVLYFFDTLLVNLLAALICALAVMELLHAAGLTRYRTLTAVSIAFSAFLIFVNAGPLLELFAPCCCLYAVFCFCYLLAHHDRMDARDLSYSLMMTLLVTVSFYCLVTIRDRSSAQLGVFYLVMVFGSAWWSDAGGYFVGTFFGKHKLCPAISPKKTVEGLVGGVVNAILGNLLVAFLFQEISSTLMPLGYFDQLVQADLMRVLLVTPALSLLGVLGDLSASVIKRQNGIKDFGNIMPGHGGVMDRFDSVLFVSPVMFLIFKFFPLISVI